MFVFLDTNVLVAALATRGLCADVLRETLAEHHLLVSVTVIGELARALAQTMNLSAAAIDEVEAFLKSSAIVADNPAKPLPVAIADPDDAAVLDEAIASGASVFVTGDAELLALDEVTGARILDPRGFWELVRANPMSWVWKEPTECAAF